MLFPGYKDYIYKVLAIDPGSNFTGVSLFEVSLVQEKILSVKSRSIDVNKLKNDSGLIEELVGERLVRYFKLRNEFARILQEENIHFIAYEGPFMNKMRPNAYGPLVSLMTLIQDVVVNFSQGIPFIILQPQSVKKAIGVSGKKGKGVIKEAIERHPDLMEALKVGNTDLTKLDDNAIDSIAVGYCAIKREILLR